MPILRPQLTLLPLVLVSRFDAGEQSDVAELRQLLSDISLSDTERREVAQSALVLLANSGRQHRSDSAHFRLVLDVLDAATRVGGESQRGQQMDSNVSEVEDDEDSERC